MKCYEEKTVNTFLEVIDNLQKDIERFKEATKKEVQMPPAVCRGNGEDILSKKEKKRDARPPTNAIAKALDGAPHFLTSMDLIDLKLAEHTGQLSLERRMKVGIPYIQIKNLYRYPRSLVKIYLNKLQADHSVVLLQSEKEDLIKDQLSRALNFFSGFPSKISSASLAATGLASKSFLCTIFPEHVQYKFENKKFMFLKENLTRFLRNHLHLCGLEPYAQDLK